MAKASSSTATTNNTFLRFVECCTGTIILFRGSLPIVNGSIYSYSGVSFAGSGGNLENGRCYTITQEVTTNPVAYPAVPLFTTLSLTTGCEDPQCFDCNPANDCDCPEGYSSIDGICVGIESINPIPPTNIIFTGNERDLVSSPRGLLTYQSLNNFIWPLIATPQLSADAVAMTIIPFNGANPITGDTWTTLNPLPQTGINLNKHQPVTTPTGGGFPSLPSPPNPPVPPGNTTVGNPPMLRPVRESTITGTTLNYGAGSIISYDNYILGGVWDIWYNDVAVWRLPGLAVENQYAGFLACLEPTVTTTYQIIMQCNNGLRFFIDNYLAVEILAGDGATLSLQYSNHFQVTLTPGLHILRLECYNYSSGGGLAVEILECNASTVYGFTNLNDFIPYRKFSSLWKKSRTLTVTGAGNSTVTLTSGTTLPTDISGFIVQTSGSGLPSNLFITSVINTNTYTVNQNVPIGVYQVRLQFAYDVSSIASNSYSCPEGYTLTTCDGIVCTKTLELPCKSNCYLFMPCDGTDTFVTNDFAFEPYINQFATVQTETFYGCAFIIKLDDNDCEDSIKVDIDPDIECACELRCFYVSNTNGFLYVDADDVLQEITSADAKPYVRICSKIYPVVANNSVNYSITELGDCTIEDTESKCPVLCFKLTSCTNENIIIYSNSDALLPYAVGTNNIVTVIGKEGCWKVSLSTADCSCLTLDIVTPSTSFTANALVVGTYLGQSLYMVEQDGITYYIWFSGKGWIISQNDYGFGDLTDILLETPYAGDCPSSIANSFIWTATIDGYSATTEICPALCDCPIDIIVTSSYALCQDCIGYIAYRLVSCINSDVIYTLLNLEEYIGQVVKIDCGCYTVQQINYLPANPQLIKLEDIYTNCIECNRTYWKLTDCTGEATPIITYSDLGGYVGKAVKIKDCTECWNVEPTTEHIGAISVLVTEAYTDCIDCGIPTVCECSTITNLNETTKVYGYYDCDNIYHEITLAPGETSDKFCVLQWVAPNYCDCFLLKYTIGKVKKTVIASATGQILNGYPVFSVCIGLNCGTASFNGTNWIIYNQSEDPLYIMYTPTPSSCPYGLWRPITPPVPDLFSMESYACNETCNCITLTITEGSIVTVYTYTITGYDSLSNPIYTDVVNGTTLSFDATTGCWGYFVGSSKVAQASLCTDLDCPVGNFGSDDPNITYIAENCTVPPITPGLLITDYIEFFGECKFGNCPQPEIKNNRTIKPGYNTPNCNPDRYDEITCKFADVMYKIVLEKRYGITNCCPEDDEKWLLLKELIDLQALKDPNYHCPNCPCACNSGKSYSSCNCGN